MNRTAFTQLIALGVQWHVVKPTSLNTLLATEQTDVLEHSEISMQDSAPVPIELA